MTPVEPQGWAPQDQIEQRDSPGHVKAPSDGQVNQDHSGLSHMQMQALSERLLPSIQAIESAADMIDPDFYSVRIEWKTGGLTIFRKGGSGDLDQTYQSFLSEDIALEIQASTISVSERKEIVEILHGNFGPLQERGIVLVWFGVEDPGDGLCVQYQGATSLTRADIPGLSRFSDHQVRFERGAPVIRLNRH